MSYALTYGAYSFPPSMFPANISPGRKIPSTKIPRRDGAVQQQGYDGQLKITLRGGIINTAGLQAQLDALKAALRSGPANLTTDSDRFYRLVQYESYSDTYEGSWYGRIVTVQVDMVTGDPYAYDSTLNTTDIIASSGVVTAGGTAPAAPKLSLTMAATGTLALTVTNSTTGEAFTLGGAVTGGQVIVVDSLLEAVTIASVDQIALFDGLFPSMQAAVNNTFTLTLGGGSVGVSAASVEWNNRYWS